MGPIARDPVEIEAKSLSEIKEYFSNDSGLKEWLASSAVAVNDVMVLDLNHPLNSDDKVTILPPVCGG